MWLEIYTRKADYYENRKKELDEQTEELIEEEFSKYEKFDKHHIEISKWVMELEDNIIKNTIMHELIHCMPYCNNHGTEFKKYANLINNNYGYDISRVGNKRKDFEKSNIDYNEKENYNYRIICTGCGQEFYRQRLSKSFTRKFRCGKCGNSFKVSLLK